MEVYFHSKEPLFDYKNLFLQTNNCLFILYKNLEYEIISISNLSSFKKNSSNKESLIFYPEKIDDLIDYINVNVNFISCVLCPSSFFIFLKDIQVNNKILFYDLENKNFMHSNTVQLPSYTSIFCSYKTQILLERKNIFLRDVNFSKIGFLCKINEILNYKKYISDLNSNNVLDEKKIKELSQYNNVLWINNSNSNISSETNKILNDIRNSYLLDFNVVVSQEPNFNQKNAISFLKENNCCAYLVIDDVYSTSFLESKILLSNAPMMKISNLETRQSYGAGLMYLSNSRIDKINHIFKSLKRDLSSDYLVKIKRLKKYINNILKVHEVCNILALEAMANFCGKNIDELLLNSNLDYINNNKELYQFVRNFNNW